MHVRIDGKLDDWRKDPHSECWLNLVNDFCVDAVKITGLNLISGPHTAEFGGTVQALAILAESHVSIEVLRELGVYYVDVFTCAPFKMAPVVGLCEQNLGPPRRIEIDDRGDNLAEIKG